MNKALKQMNDIKEAISESNLPISYCVYLMKLVDRDIKIYKIEANENTIPNKN